MIDNSKDVIVLVAGGFFGSLAKLVLSPEQDWRRWLVRFVVGVSSAVFLGGFVGQLLMQWFEVPARETLAAAGFLVGVSCEQLISMLQARLVAGRPPRA